MKTDLTKSRITSIDLLRGVVMIIMALDHVRDYFHADAFIYDPLDLEKTKPVLFFTRWITHFCAPVFMFLAGTSASLVGERKSKKELSMFLFKRGAWLILLELTVINFGWNFDITFNNIYFIVIWVLGLSMIALAAAVHLPRKWIFIIGLLILAGHNLLDGIHVQGNTFKAFAWALVHDQNLFTWASKNILVGYPVLPWIGIIMLGYCFGALYSPAFGAEKRKKWLLNIGGGAVLLFIIIRFANFYGDPGPWSKQDNFLKTFLDFISTTKYPPSLLYALMTLGPSVLFLAFTERANNTFTKFISIYGRVPMFYYILHIYLLHAAALVATGLFTGFSWQIWVLKEPLWLTQTLKGYGFSLGIVYIVWIGIVLFLYPLCKWYDRYKQNHKEKWWLSYL
ncbi:heparan-alpha-glucosaminide N-acetyltransferase domain-containing protein [Lacibacter sp. H375]|uniref:DUF1624 domain-containing protein n=1 Tax=Lacibacter sp. H375 TaxID=3133424 RepID=UPI0030C4E0CE